MLNHTPTLRSIAFATGIGWSLLGPVASVRAGEIARGETPTTTGIADVAVLEDAAPSAVDLYAAFADAEDPDEALIYSVESISAPGLLAASLDAGTLFLTYLTDAFGETTVTVRATDTEGLFVETAFAVDVASVNDPPSFSRGPDLTIDEDAGPQNIAWASAIRAGPDNESGQSLAFLVDTGNPTLFAVLPAIAEDGTLTFTPAPGASGVSVVDVSLTDNAGTQNGGREISDTETFTIEVNAQADPPTTSGIDDVFVLEDASNTTVDLFEAFEDPDGPDDGLMFSIVANTNPGLFANLSIDAGSGTLTLDYAANQNGASTLTVRATDPESEFVDASFTVTATAVNDAPSFTRGGDLSVGEDAGAQTFPGWATGISAGPTGDEASQTLAFAVSAANSGLFAVQPAISSLGTLTFTPATNAAGSSTVTASLSDDGGTANGGVDTSPVQTFTITVSSANDPPTTSGIANVSVLEDATSSVIDLFAAFADPEDSDNALTYTIPSNSNPALFASTNILQGAGTLTLDYAAEQNGSATLTVRATDTGGLFVDAVFTVTVIAVNDAPSFTKGPDQSVNEGGPPVSIPGWATNISPGPTNENGQILSFSTSNTNSGLFTQQPAVSSAGALTFNVANNVSGSATVTVTLSDDGGTANGGLNTSAPQAFVISVSNINDPPTTSGIANVQDLEDAANRVVDLFAAFADVEDPDNALAYTVVANTNPALFSAITTSSSTGALTLDYAPNAFGTANLTVRATDTGGLFVETLFTVTVLAVNDAPSFVAGPAQTVAEDAPAQLVRGWATAISAGPANEGDQTVAFQLSTPSTALFTVLPAMAPNGDLSYTPAPNANGTATVTIVLQDNGGTSNGGLDQSTPYPFTITLSPVNDVPVAINDVYTVIEGQSLIAAAGGSPPGVLDNDLDPDGQTLTAAVIQGPLFASTWSFNTNGSFVYVHNGSENVVDSLLYIANDGTAASNVATVYLNIKESNDPPASSGIANVSVLEDAPDTPVALFDSFSDPDDPDNALVYTVQSNSNPSLFTAVTVDPVTGVLVLNYAPNANGSSTLAVRATDPGALFVQTSFTVTVGPVNDPPSMIPGDPIVLGEDPGPQSIPGWAQQIVPGPPDEVSQALTVSLSNDNNALFATPPSLTVVQNTGTLAFVPATNASGIATVTITLGDNGGTANGGSNSATYTFTIAINSDNDAPTSTGIADATVREDAAPLAYDLFAVFDDAEDEDAALVFSIEGEVDTSLFESVSIAGTPAVLSVSFTQHAFGSGTVSVRATDTEGLWKQEDILYTVTPVNDAPSFAVGPDLSLPQNAPPQRIEGWATAISPGAENEADQSLDFTLTTDNDALFLVLPDVGPDGTLTYATASGEEVFGTAVVTAILADNGGTADGGADTSAPQTFRITLNRFNTPPDTDEDNYVIRQGGTLTVPVAAGVLANDSDAENDPLTARLVDGPTNAVSFTLNPDGSFTYRHNNTQTSDDTFTYVANDGIDDSGVTNVFIAITPSGTLSLPDVTVLEDADDTVIALHPTFEPLYPEGTVLVYELASVAGAGLFEEISVDSLSGTVVLDYAPNQAGVASLGFRATGEGTARLASVAVTVLPLNDTPIAVDDIAATIENEPVLITVLANDVDVDGDNLTIQSFSSPTAGTVQPGLNGTFLYNPPGDYTGRATFTYTVVDDSTSTDRATVTVTVFAGQFDIVELGPEGSLASSALGISNIGEAVGTANTGALPLAFSSERPLETASTSTAYDVNDFGTAVGAHLTDGALLAARWDSLGLTSLGALDGRSSLAYGINNEGRIVGTSTQVGVEALRAFRWLEGEMVELEAPVDAESQAFDVSERGLASGYAGANAVLWSDRSVFRTFSGNAGRAYALNENGQAVGSIDDGTVKAVFWEAGGSLQVIHDPATTFSEAYAINNSTWVVGAYRPATTGKTAATAPIRRADALRHAAAGTSADSLTRRGEPGAGFTVASASDLRAFLWRNGVIEDLNTFIDASSGWTLVEATGINNAAQIVGYGVRNGVTRAFLLSPSTNSSPKAADDLVRLTFVERVAIDLLANDRDDDGDSLFVLSIAPAEFGTVTLGTDGHALYVPGPAFDGRDAFTYTVSDGRGGRAEARVTVERAADALPAAFALEPNFPNPFASTTTIGFALPEPAHVTLEVFNLLGQRVQLLVDGPRPAGRHRVVLDARSLPAGAYAYRMQTGAVVVTRTMLLIR